MPILSSRLLRATISLATLGVCLGAQGATPATATAPPQTGDLGTIGPVYAVIEPDPVEEIKARLKRMQEAGDFERLRRQEIAQTRWSLQHPPRVEGIHATTVRRTHYWDPTIIVNRDIFDNEGNLVIARGTKVNPFDIVKVWNRVLLFFDGTDSSQVAWAKTQLDRYGYRAKPILVNGNPFDLMKRWKRPVYFDQGGIYSRKLEIAQVPAFAYQEGRKVRIDEVEPTDETHP